MGATKERPLKIHNEAPTLTNQRTVKRDDLMKVVNNAVRLINSSVVAEAVVQNASTTDRIAWGAWFAITPEELPGNKALNSINAADACGCALAQAADVVQWGPTNTFGEHPGQAAKNYRNFVRAYDRGMKALMGRETGIAVIED